MMQTTESRLELYSQLTEQIRQFDLADVKISMRKRYRGEDNFDRLSMEQLKDLLAFLRNAGKVVKL